MSKPPLYSFVVALFFGLISAVAPASLPLEYPSLVVALLVSAVIFGAAGLVLGVLWPAGGWKWGLWVVAPGLLFVTLGIISSGDVVSFLTDDVLFLVSGVVTAALGGAWGGRWRGAADTPAHGSEQG